MSSVSPRAQVLAFLADIKEHPDEDGLRLILADWLDDHGGPEDQARAELIRCQIEFGRLPPESPHRQPAGRRARGLQQQHGPAWLGPLREYLAGWTIRRGLLSVTVEAGALRGPAQGRLAASEAWAWVDEVYLLGATDADLVHLRRCPLLESVVSLGLRQCHLSPGGMLALGGLPPARRLCGLDLGQCGVGDSGVRALAQAGLDGLRSLELPGNDLGPAGAAALAAAPLPGLRRLILWGNRLGDAGVSRLATARWPLAQADFRGNQIGDAGGVALAGWESLAAARELNLADNPLGPVAAEALAASPLLAGIGSLVLWGSQVGAAGAEALRRRFGPRVHVSPPRS